MNNRDSDVLEHIIRYCDEIDETKNYFGNSRVELESNKTEVQDIGGLTPLKIRKAYRTLGAGQLGRQR